MQKENSKLKKKGIKLYEVEEELSKIEYLKKWAIVLVGERCVVNQEIL